MKLDTEKLDGLLASFVAEEKAEIGVSALSSAVQGAVGRAEEVLYRGAAGRVDLESAGSAKVEGRTRFDVASVTKALVGSTLAMIAVDEGRVELETPIGAVFEPWRKRGDGQEVTLLDVLSHSSGLPAWRKFYLEHPVDPTVEGAEQCYEEVVRKILATPLEGARGERHCYSDLGYLLLRGVLEAVYGGARLEELARTLIFERLGMEGTGFVSLRRGDELFHEAVVTEECALRRRLIRGEVHDENTHIIGGVSTHAGVFSTAEDLLRFGQHLLAIDRGRRVEDPIVSRGTLRRFWSPGLPVAGSHLAGWDRPSGSRSSAGRYFTPEHTVGHLGFTGTSIWIEREKELVSVFLSNRVYPTRVNQVIKEARIAFQEAIFTERNDHE